MNLHVKTEKESNGRWIAEVPEIPGAMCYGPPQSEAVARAKALALRVLADRLEHGKGCRRRQGALHLESKQSVN